MRGAFGHSRFCVVDLGVEGLRGVDGVMPGPDEFPGFPSVCDHSELFSHFTLTTQLIAARRDPQKPCSGCPR